MDQPLSARVADYCTGRPGIRFTAEQAALALGAPLAGVTDTLDHLVKHGVNGTLIAFLAGYVFTDDPSAGITASCSRNGCTPQAMCADCAGSLIDVLTGEQDRQVRRDDDAEAGLARAAALGRRITWIRSHTQRGDGPALQEDRHLTREV